MNRLPRLLAASLSIALLGSCGDDRSAGQPTYARLDPGVQTAARADEAGAWTRLRCGDADVAVDFSVAPVRLLVGDEAIALHPVPAASGAKYEAIGDPTTTLWSKGEAAMLTLRGTSLPECHASAADASRPPASVPSALP